MKKLYITLFVLAVLFACDEEKRVPEVMNAPNFRMQLHPDNSYFNFADIDNAKLVYDVFSQNFNEIERVDVTFRYQRNGSPTCANRGCLGPFTVKSYTSADLAAEIQDEEITIQDVTALLGMTPADLTGGDQFFFQMVTTMKDGRVYPSITVGANDNVPTLFDQPGASYTSAFNAIVGCPLTAAFTGNYKVQQIQGDYNWNSTGSTDPAVNPVFGNLSSTAVTAVNPITRSVNVTYLGFTARPMTFILLCGGVAVPTQSSGLACSGVAINWTTAGVEGIGGVLGSYDPASDATFDIQFVDNPTNGCGDDTNLTILRFTKL